LPQGALRPAYISHACSQLQSKICLIKYFFHEYHWQSRKILNKVDNGLENWVLPWAHLLAIPKNMLNFIYLERGYELSHRIAVLNRSSFDRVFG
jgi:predicted nucleic acid-binding protein